MRNKLIITMISFGLNVLFYLAVKTNSTFIIQSSILCIILSFIGFVWLLMLNKKTHASNKDSRWTILGLIGIVINLYFLFGWSYWFVFKDFGF